MKKKLISTLLALALILSFGAPAFAVSYSDLEGHWSKEYMTDLSNRGLLQGYEDSTMRPENNITVCESLVLLSRFYKHDDEAAELVYNDYGEFVEETAGAKLSWAFKPLTVCLAAGIVTKDELSSLNLGAAIEKELLAVFLVRAMKLEDSAKSLTAETLDFDDASRITASYRGHVVVLVKAEVVKGDENNNFSPKLSVTRAVVATMVSRALEYMEKWDVELTLDEYDGVFRSSGIITGVMSGGFRICGYDGLTREFALPSDANVTVNGEKKELTASYVGRFATVSEKEGAVSALAVEDESKARWVQGVVSQVRNSSSNNQIYITDISTDIRATYTLSSDARIFQNEDSITFSRLTYGNFVTAKLESNAITTIHSFSGRTEVIGSVSSISFGQTVTMKVKDSDSRTWMFQFDITNLPAIYRDTTEISIDRLSTGDEVVIDVSKGRIRSITTTAKEATLTGEITSVVMTTSGTSWVIKSDDGETATYLLDRAANAYSNNKAIDISTIGVGDKVAVVVYSNVITEVYLVSPYVSTEKLNCSVLMVDSSKRELTVLAADKLIYVDCLNLSYIIDAATGKSVTLASIDQGNSLVVYGSYSSATAFTASSIIIES